MNMASSSFSPGILWPQEKYDVFLSFRGEDTRNTFTSHLYAAFRGKKITTYIDEKLESGDQISSAIIEAIEQSKVSVIIFSQNYASSTWCLDELVHILQCKQNYGQLVIPIFYDVHPSHVRRQEASYAAAFAQLEQRFENSKDKLLKWKDALSKAADLSGFDNSDKKKTESDLVQTIVKDISTKLNRQSSCDLKGLVGIEKHIEDIELLLCIEALDVRTIGIWGMGGIGKTTLADAVYNRLSSEFDACCFLANVREESEKHGLNYLRNELLAVLLKEENINVGTPSIGSPFVRDRLCRTKALVVLDDVNNSSQLESLVGDCNLSEQFLGTRSRIIITTRNKGLLKKRVDDDKIYELRGLSFNEALRLFHLKAFGNNSTTIDYTELSRMVVDYANGLPLALKVLGSSFLHCNNKEDWESELSKLKKAPNPEILRLLRISYEGLDKGEKKIFLHIACLYKGEDINDAKIMLDLCGFVVVSGIRVLIDMSLISIINNRLQMHDLVQKMGWEIVREQHEEEPGERSIIWSPEDAYHVLKNKTGTKRVEAIFLNMSKIEDLYLGRKVFKTMYNLRLLKLYNYNDEYGKVHVCDQGLQSLPDALRYLHWDGCPLKSLPSKFSACNLVELRMRGSQVETLWNKGQNIRNLKKIDLSESRHLTEVPDLSQCQNIEEIDLSYCRSLVQIPAYFEYLDKLQNLLLVGCLNLKHLPEIPINVERLELSGTAIEELPSSVWSHEKLRFLYLTSCKKLKNLPSSTCKLYKLRRLYLEKCSSLGKVSEFPRKITTLYWRQTAIEVVPSSIFDCLSGLVSIDLEDCKRLESLSSNICKLKSLYSLSLKGCSKFECFPEISEPMERLTVLDLRGTAVRELSSSSIENLIGPGILYLYMCKNLKSIPRSIFNLNLQKLPTFPDGPISLYPLKRINLSGSKIESLPASIKQVRWVEYIDLSNCKSLRSLQLQELPLLLKHLDAHGCTSLETVSGSITALTQGWNQDGRPVHTERFIFSNCLRLDQNWSNILMADHAHIMSMFHNYLSVGICCSGNEIPKWFSYQSEGSSINTKLPPHWFDTNFLGFSLCIVMEFHNYNPHDERGLEFECKSHFITNNGETLKFNSELYSLALGENKNRILNSDHVLLWYDCPLYQLREFKGEQLNTRLQEYGEKWPKTFNIFTEATFNFYPIHRRRQLVYKGNIKKCGICLLYAQDVKEKVGVTEEVAPTPLDEEA